MPNLYPPPKIAPHKCLMSAVTATSPAKSLRMGVTMKLVIRARGILGSRVTRQLVDRNNTGAIRSAMHPSSLRWVRPYLIARVRRASTLPMPPKTSPKITNGFEPAGALQISAFIAFEATLPRTDKSICAALSFHEFAFFIG